MLVMCDVIVDVNTRMVIMNVHIFVNIIIKEVM